MTEEKQWFKKRRWVLNDWRCCFKYDRNTLTHGSVFIYTVRGTLGFPKWGNPDKNEIFLRLERFAVLFFSPFFFFSSLVYKAPRPKNGLSCNISICACYSIVGSFAVRTSPHDGTIAHGRVANPRLAGSSGVAPLALLPIQARRPGITWLPWFADPCGSHWTY